MTERSPLQRLAAFLHATIRAVARGSGQDHVLGAGEAVEQTRHRVACVTWRQFENLHRAPAARRHQLCEPSRRSSVSLLGAFPMSALQGGDVFPRKVYAASAWSRPIPRYAGHRTFSWDRLDPQYGGPHDAAAPTIFQAHIGGYSGHVPHSWDPKSCAISSSHRSCLVSPLVTAGSSSVKRARPYLQGYAGHRPVNWIPRPAPSRSVSLTSEKTDGFGPIRLGTPTTEQRERHRQQLLEASGGTHRSASTPVIRPASAARFGYMPPEVGSLRPSVRTGDGGDASTPASSGRMPRLGVGGQAS